MSEQVSARGSQPTSSSNRLPTEQKQSVNEWQYRSGHAGEPRSVWKCCFFVVLFYNSRWLRSTNAWMASIVMPRTKHSAERQCPVRRISDRRNRECWSRSIRSILRSVCLAWLAFVPSFELKFGVPGSLISLSRVLLGLRLQTQASGMLPLLRATAGYCRRCMLRTQRITDASSRVGPPRVVND